MKFNGKTLSVAAEFTATGYLDSYYDEFWDSVQENGTRTEYNYSFCHTTWTDAIFKPKYNMQPTKASYMFTQSRITDLQAALDRAGVTLDFSKLTSAHMTRSFDGSDITRIGVVNLADAGLINTFFAGATELKTIDKLVLSESNTLGAKMFENCTKLENITIDGTIADSLDMSMCPLSVDSMKSVISHLKNILGFDYTRTIKLSQDCWQKLDAAGGQPYGDSWAAYYEGRIEPFGIQFSEVMTKMLFTFREQTSGNEVLATSSRLQYMSNADKLQVSAQMADRGLMTRNEIREIWNLAPLPEPLGSQLPVRGEYYNVGEENGEENPDNGSDENDQPET